MCSIERMVVAPFQALATIAVWFFVTLLLIVGFVFLVAGARLLLDHGLIEVAENVTIAIWKDHSSCKR